MTESDAQTAYGGLAQAVRCWAAVNDGALNRMQVRELLRALDSLHEKEAAVQKWMTP